MSRLEPGQLVRRWAPEAFDFESTASLEPLEGAVGQRRALEALELAVGVDQPGFNLFVVGEPETGRFEATLRRISELAAALDPPDRWCYVNNFRDSDPARRAEAPGRDRRAPARRHAPAGRGAALGDPCRTRK